MPIAPEVSPAMLADELKPVLAGKLDAEKIDAVVESVSATTTTYPAHGALISMIFFMIVKVEISGAKTFDGKAGGVAVPGGGGCWGTVYTDDLNRLYSSTVSFAFTTTPVYVAVYFFDGNSNHLGHFQAGAVSTSTGTGGGSGGWS